MTVKELIEELEKMPKDAEVVGFTGEGDTYEIRHVFIQDEKVCLDE